MTYGQVWWPILRIHALHLTHPKWSHLCCGARGAFRGSVPCSRAPQSWYWECCTFTPLQFLPARDSNSQPLDLESDSLTIRPWLPPHAHLHTHFCLFVWNPSGVVCFTRNLSTVNSFSHLADCKKFCNSRFCISCTELMYDSKFCNSSRL